jgi:hypothetical protein
LSRFCNGFTLRGFDFAQPDNASTSLSLTINFDQPEILWFDCFYSNLEISCRTVTSFFALGMGAASPDLEKQGFLAVVFVNREYSGQPDPWGTPKL